MEKEKKEKRIILILVLILFVSIIGFTIAYFMRSVSVENEFNTKDFETTAYEEFVSPNNWLPCDETPKTITVTNTGNVDAAVRISMQEKWVNANGNVISGLIDSNGNLTNNTNSEHAAIINIADDCNWQEDNGYYYYKHILKPGETTTALTDSVTFNCKTNASQTCTTSQDGKTVTCTSSGDGYDNANYTLTFKIDTIQYDAYEDVWTDDVHISDISYNPSTDSCNSGGNNNPNTNSCSNESDETITYNGEDYYVLDSSNSEYTTLLKKDVLTASEVNAVGTDIDSEDGEYPYAWGNGCDISEIGNCYLYSNYDDSSIKTIIDGWSNKFGNDLVEINGYKARLLNEDELIYRLGFEYYNVVTSYGYETTECTPNWATINDKFYWIDVSNEGIKKGVVKEEINYNNICDSYYIRPVINVKKCVLNNTCQSEATSGVQVEPEVEINGVEKLLSDATNTNDIVSYNDETADKSKMFKFIHSNTVDYRYIGNNPNNYVYFNCTDENNISSCELWRIIGIFSVEKTDPTDSSNTITEARIKIVRDSKLNNRYQWNDDKNDWYLSSIKNYLNGEYYNNLSNKSKQMIDDAKYYLGAILDNTEEYYDSTLDLVVYNKNYGTTEEIYNFERGNNVCGSCNNNINKLTWEGKIALMYPSDIFMTYGKGVDNTCYLNPTHCYQGNSFNYNWINDNYMNTFWLLSSASNLDNKVFCVDVDLYTLELSDSNYIMPTLYLKSDVMIIKGNGSSRKPYVLKMPN